MCRSARFSNMVHAGVRRAMMGAVTLSLMGIMGLHTAWADEGLSREAILRQHQALAQKHENAASDNETGDEATQAATDPVSLAPPLAGASSANTQTESSTARAQGSNDLVANLLGRVNALEGQVRDLRGQVDQLTNQQHQDEETVTKQLGDMQFALQNSGHAGRAAIRTAPAATETTRGEKAADSTATPPRDATTALQAGHTALKARRYKEAEEDARLAVKEGKGSWSKTEAQFLLAQSLAGQKSYKNAALTYYDIYSRTPDSPRAPESLLGVSASMLALGNKSAACEALQRLNKEYPKASSRVKASEKIFSQRAACH